MKDIQVSDSALPISKTEYKNFIDGFDLNLPESYKEFIFKHNGGYSRLSSYGNPYDGGFKITAFARISSTDESIIDILGKDEVISSRFIIQTHQINEKNIAKNFYPFGIDGGGSFYCIDTNDHSIHKVYLDNTTESKFVTSSFENFINGLEDPKIYDED